MESAELDYYEKVAKRYHSLHSQPIQKYHTKVESELIRPHLLPSQRVLVVGCGGGREFEYFLGVEATVVGVDFSREMLAQAREKIRSLEPSIDDQDPVSRFSLVQADATSLPFRNAEFDIVLCLSTLNYIPEYEQAVREMYRVLKPRGTLIISVINRLEFAEIVKRAFRYIGVRKTSHGLEERKNRVFRKTFTLSEIKDILCRNNLKIVEVYGLRLLIDLIPHRWNTQQKYFSRAERIIRFLGWIDRLLLQFQLLVRFARFILLVGEKSGNG